MTDRSLAIRLSVTDGAKLKATLSDVGESGQRALKRIEDASAPASRALMALDGAAGHVMGTMEGMSGRLGTLGAALGGLGPAGFAAGAALAAVGAGLVRGIQDAAEAERSYRRLEAVLAGDRPLGRPHQPADHRVRRGDGALHAGHHRGCPGSGGGAGHLPQHLR